MMNIPKELVEQWRTEYYRSATPSYLPEYIAQRAAEWALSQPVSMEPDKRMKVKLGGTYGHELVGHWFYLHPADEFAEKALEDRTGIATQQPLSKEQCGYDETTGNCTRSSCCRAEPVSMEPVDWDQEIYSRTRTFIQTNEIEAIKEIAATQLAAARLQGAEEERKKADHWQYLALDCNKRVAELEAASDFDHAEYKRLRGELEQKNAVLLEALKRIADEQNFFALGAARIIASEALAIAEVKP